MSTEVLENPLNLITPPGTFKFIELLNPFAPNEREEVSIAWLPGMTLLDAFSPLTDFDNVAVTLNGGLIETADFGITVIPEQACVVWASVARGGNTGKTLLRMAVVIAAAVTGQYYAAQWAVGAGYAVGSAGYLAAGAAGGAFAAMGAGLLVNSLMPLAATKVGESEADSQSYGIDGAKNTSEEGIRVPACYGPFRMAGNIIDMHVHNVSGDQQYLYMLINAGEGPVVSLTDIEINDQPISNFTDVEVQTRLGLPDQDVIPWFAETISPHSVGTTLINPGYSTYTSGPGDIIDRFRLDFVAPSGIWEMSDKGERKAVTVTVNADYRIVGSGTWTPLVPGTTVDGYEDAYFITTQVIVGRFLQPTTTEYSVLPSGHTISGTNILKGTKVVGYVQQKATYGGALSVTVNEITPYRWSVYSPILPQGRYEVRVRRTNTEAATDKKRDTVVLSDFNSIIVDPVAYVNTALVALKIKLSDQLSGIPNVTYLNGGKLVTYWDPATSAWLAEASTNPAWVTYDAIINQRYGGRVDPARVDEEAWKAWAAYCVDKGLTFNGVVDAQMNLWDALQAVFRVGHARWLPIGNKYSVATDCPTTPSMLFASGNMASGSFSQQWLGTQSRANEIEVSYFDKMDRNKQRSIKVYDDLVAAGAPQNTTSITLYGVDTVERATEEGIFQLRLNRFIRSTCSFEAPIEAIGCTTGDVVIVQHEQPEWGVGGRTEGGSTTTTIALDRPVEVEVGKSYRLLVHFSALQRLTGTVTGIVGNALTLSGYTGQQNLHRIQIGGQDHRVTGFHAGGVFVESLTGISVSATYTAYETDVIETRTVTNTSGIYSNITVSSGFTVAPGALANFMFGEQSVVSKLWRINSITLGSDKMSRKVSCFEYDEQVYDWTNPLGTAVQPPGDFNRIVPHVTNLTLKELTSATGTATMTYVGASWSPPADYPEYGGVELFVAVDGAPLTSVGIIRAGGISSYEFQVYAGSQVIVRAVAFATDGRKAAYSNAPTENLTTSGDAIAPKAPSSVTLVVPQVGIQVNFVPPIDIDFVGCEIWRNTTNNFGTASLIFITDKTQTSYVDLTVEDPEQNYYYWVRAKDDAGNLSAQVASTPPYQSPNAVASSLNGVLTAEVTGVPASSAGVVSDFSLANGFFKVYRGASDVTSEATFSVVSQTGLTGTINTAVDTPVSGQPAGYYRVTAMSADVGRLVMRAVVEGVNIDKVFSVIKIRQGSDGDPGEGLEAISVAINNHAMALPAYSNGNVISFANCDGFLKVYAGGTDVTAAATLSAVGTGLTGTINTATNTPVTGQPKGYYQVTAMSAQSGFLTMHAVYDGVTYEVAFSVSRAEKGFEIAGTLPASDNFAGRMVFLTVDNKLYRYTGSTWTAAVATSDLTGAILGSQVANSTLSLNKLLTLGSPGALNSDSECVDSTQWVYSAYSGSVTAGIVDPAAPGGAGMCLQTVGEVNFRNAKVFTIRPGASYRITFYARRDATTTGVMYMRVWQQDANAGNIQYFAGLEGINLNVAWTRYTGTFVGDATAVRALVDVHAGYNGGSGTTQVCRFSDIRVEECVPTDLIVNGAINADKIAANAVTASKIVAGSVTTDKLDAGAITTDKIAAGAVTAAKITVNQLDALTATLGLMRTASSGARLEIESNQLRVYDSSNVLRVRLGIW